MSATSYANTAYMAATPRLSVLTPFYRYDPCALIERLAAETSTLNGAVELVLLDDGGGDLVLSAIVTSLLDRLSLPARLVTLSANEGRSRGRNRLVADARADYVLFLDCDMAPDGADFLARWLDLITADAPAAAFGGFSLEQITPKPEHRLHYALQQRGECVGADVRRMTPEKYIYTSNLLVRRDVLAAEPFDEGFTGWGWEDVEWGMRVAARFGVTHIDNTATHLGLDTAGALLGKYEQSAGNFARVLARHPGVVRGYPSYRVSRLLKAVPGRRVWRGWLKALATSDAPLASRIAAAKLYRAAIYAEADG